MAVSATQLRQNIYAILDEALATGKPIEMERRGKVLRIVPERSGEDLSDEEFAALIPAVGGSTRLMRDDGAPTTGDLANMDWSEDFTELVERRPNKKKRV